MADEPENIIVAYLRRIEIKLEQVHREVQALKAHSVADQDSLLAIRKDIQNLEIRVARIETRLELRDLGPAAHD